MRVWNWFLENLVNIAIDIFFLILAMPGIILLIYKARILKDFIWHYMEVWFT